MPALDRLASNRPGCGGATPALCPLAVDVTTHSAARLKLKTGRRAWYDGDMTDTSDEAGKRRCDLRAFILDLLDFAMEQLELSRVERDRAAALDAAQSAFVVLGSRAWENQAVGTLISITDLEQWALSPHRADHWNALGKQPAGQFAISLDTLLGTLRHVKGAIRLII
jgi:hypothetical protein